MSISVVVVDDEAPARAKLRKLLAAAPSFEITGEAADGSEAVETIRRIGPDVVFLDIQMPEMDGFDVIREIGPDAMPLVVFVTAYDEYALEAFEVHAFDYLLKPFAPSRFRKLLGRLEARFAAASSGEEHDRLKRLLQAIEHRAEFITRILVRKSEEREVLLPVDRIDIVRSEGNYLRFLTREGEFTRRGTLGELEERLDPRQFVRINRAEIVRLDAMKELNPWFHGDYRVIMADGTRLTFSRRYRARVKGDLLR